MERGGSVFQSSSGLPKGAIAAAVFFGLAIWGELIQTPGGGGLFALLVLGGVLGGSVWYVMRTVEERKLLAEGLAQDHTNCRAEAMRKFDVLFDPALPERDRLDVLYNLSAYHIRRRFEAQDPCTGPLRDSFVLVAELSPALRARVQRARQAVSIVETSRVMELDMLDGIANNIILPQQVWEIARLLEMQDSLEQ